MLVTFYVIKAMASLGSLISFNTSSRLNFGNGPSAQGAVYVTWRRLPLLPGRCLRGPSHLQEGGWRGGGRKGWVGMVAGKHYAHRFEEHAEDEFGN